MALNSRSVRKAWEILNSINPDARNSFIADFSNLRDKLEEDLIIGVDRKSPSQTKIFLDRKSEVPNSSFIEEKKDGITRIGWF